MWSINKLCLKLRLTLYLKIINGRNLMFQATLILAVGLALILMSKPLRMPPELDKRDG